MMSSKREHKIILRKRLERVRKKSLGSGEEASKEASTSKTRPDPFKREAEQAKDWKEKSEELLERKEQEKREKKRARNEDRRKHLQRTKKGQPRLSAMIDSLVKKL